MEIIYTKYSNDRQIGYRIRTDIAIDDDGSKVVIKRPISEEDEQHIDKMYSHYQELEKAVSNTIFSINKSTKLSSGLQFEFLEGKTLEEKLDECYINKDVVGFKKLFQVYLDNMLAMGTRDFVVTPEYEDVFGKWQLDGQYKSMSISDVDMIFPNIYITDEQWNIIDYEWTYEFPVPLKFIIWRTLHYFLSFGREANIVSHVDMYNMAGITSEEREYFLRCEENFQHSLMRNYYALWNINDKMHGNIYYPYFMADAKAVNDRERHGILRIYYKSGEVEERVFEPSVDDDNNCKYGFDIPVGEVEKIEFQPYKSSCAIFISVIYAISDKGSVFMGYDTNGQEIGDNKWAFFQPPVITIPEVLFDASKIYLEYKITDIKPSALMDEVLWNEQYQNDIEEMDAKIFQLEYQVKACEHLIDEEKEIMFDLDKKLRLSEEAYERIINSNTWKAGAFFRKIRNLFRRDK